MWSTRFGSHHKYHKRSLTWKWNPVKQGAVYTCTIKYMKGSAFQQRVLIRYLIVFILPNHVSRTQTKQRQNSWRIFKWNKEPCRCLVIAIMYSAWVSLHWDICIKIWKGCSNIWMLFWRPNGLVNNVFESEEWCSAYLFFLWFHSHSSFHRALKQRYLINDPSRLL